MADWNAVRAAIDRAWWDMVDPPARFRLSIPTQLSDYAPLPDRTAQHVRGDGERILHCHNAPKQNPVALYIGDEVYSLIRQNCGPQEGFMQSVNPNEPHKYRHCKIFIVRADPYHIQFLGEPDDN